LLLAKHKQSTGKQARTQRLVLQLLVVPVLVLAPARIV
jgi:hypothetical protein